MDIVKKGFVRMENVFRSQALTSITDSKGFVFALSGVLGAVFFMLFFGVRILDPTYMDWLFMPTITDRLQHTLGWELFRNSAWGFPPGLHDGATHPFYHSVVFSDPIPLFAVPFKVLSPLLPTSFQYFGWFGLLCYFLQGGFGGLIVKRISGFSGFSIICSLFFSMSSFMTYRVFWHSALAAHFLILAAIYLCITKDINRSIKKNCAMWGAILCIAGSIHIYLLLMVFGLMCFYLLDDLFEYKNNKKTIIELCVPMVCLVLVMFLLGVFHSSSSPSDYGLGRFNSNLNQLINPNAVHADHYQEYADFSRILRPLPLIQAEPGYVTTSRQAEGNAYIGLGMIIFFFLSLFAFIDDFKDYKSNLSNKKNLRRTLFAIIAFLAYIVFALGPIITFNDMELFGYVRFLPEFILNLWSIFRATGRFMWVPAYILMIVIIWVSVRKFKKPTLIAMAILLVFVQFVDVSEYADKKGKFFREEHVWESPLRSEMWDVISNDYEHLFYVHRVSHMYSVLEFAVRNGLTVNDTDRARKDIDAIEEFKLDTMDQLIIGNADIDTVYIFDILPEQLIRDNKLFVYLVDGMILGFTAEIPNAENMSGVTRVN